MVDKCSSYSMTVFETLDFRSDMTSIGCSEANFLFANAPGDTINCQTPGTPGLIVYQMPGVCQEGMLAAGIDSHITLTYPVSTR